eukprot:8091071-Alexandrium_andersonii.AAC.1
MSPRSVDSKPWTRALCPVGLAGAAVSSIWNVGHFSSLANVLFGCAVGSTYERYPADAGSGLPFVDVNPPLRLHA